MSVKDALFIYIYIFVHLCIYNFLLQVVEEDEMELCIFSI